MNTPSFTDLPTMFRPSALRCDVLFRSLGWRDKRRPWSGEIFSRRYEVRMPLQADNRWLGRYLERPAAVAYRERSSTRSRAWLQWTARHSLQIGVQTPRP